MSPWSQTKLGRPAARRRRSSCAASTGASKTPPGAISTKAHSKIRNAVAIARIVSAAAVPIVKWARDQKIGPARETVQSMTMTVVSWLPLKRVSAPHDRRLGPFWVPAPAVGHPDTIAVSEMHPERPRGAARRPAGRLSGCADRLPDCVP